MCLNRDSRFLRYLPEMSMTALPVPHYYRHGGGGAVAVVFFK
jgi:hypothetical protein